MATKVKITGTDKARASALAFVNNFSKDKKELEDLALFTVEQIKARTRAAGRTDAEYMQPEISENTKTTRKRLIRAGNAFDQKFVKPNRSNLSMSGQLLNALYFVINSATAQIVIKLKEARRPYKGIRKAELENKLTNNEIKNDLESRGFKFFFISEKLQANLENRIAQILRRKLSIYNKLNRK